MLTARKLSRCSAHGGNMQDNAGLVIWTQYMNCSYSNIFGQGGYVLPGVCLFVCLLAILRKTNNRMFMDIFTVNLVTPTSITTLSVVKANF